MNIQQLQKKVDQIEKIGYKIVGIKNGVETEISKPSRDYNLANEIWSGLAVRYADDYDEVKLISVNV